MTQFLYFLPLMTCPIVMGAMMFFMMRGKPTTPSTSSTASTAEELSQLRQEVDQLRTMQQGSATSTPPASGWVPR